MRQGNKPTSRRPNIVVIGGGTGLPVILKSLKELKAQLTGIVTVADDGGSSGKLREAFNSVPPGDLRNVLTALSDIPELQRAIFQYRFKSKDKSFDGHAIGNFIIQATTELKGNIYEAIQLLAKMMHVDGSVYPSAEVPLVLHARYKDGTTGSGESKIAQAGKMIDYVAVSRADNHGPVEPGRKVISAIMNADMVVLGPGSLFTSILPNLMIPDLGKALLETSAKVVYICNIMTQLGETEDFTDAEHVDVLHRHLGQPFIDIALVNNGHVPFEHVSKENSEYLYQVKHDFKGLSDQVPTVISDNFLSLSEKGVFHDGPKVARELFKTANDVQGRRRVMDGYLK